jgi:hypothetical protein
MGGGGGGVGGVDNTALVWTQCGALLQAHQPGSHAPPASHAPPPRHAPVARAVHGHEQRRARLGKVAPRLGDHAQARRARAVAVGREVRRESRVDRARNVAKHDVAVTVKAPAEAAACRPHGRRQHDGKGGSSSSGGSRGGGVRAGEAAPHGRPHTP